MSVDISELSVDPENQTATMEVLHPKTGAPLTDEDGNRLVIILHGPDSKAVRDAQRKNQNRALSESMKRRKMSLSAEQLEAQILDVAIAATADWKHIGFGSSEELECTPANVRKVYESAPWMREQVSDFIAERSNFLGE